MNTCCQWQRSLEMCIDLTRDHITSFDEQVSKWTVLPSSLKSWWMLHWILGDIWDAKQILQLDCFSSMTERNVNLINHPHFDLRQSNRTTWFLCCYDRPSKTQCRSIRHSLQFSLHGRSSSIEQITICSSNGGSFPSRSLVKDDFSYLLFREIVYDTWESMLVWSFEVGMNIYRCIQLSGLFLVGLCSSSLSLLEWRSLTFAV